MVTRRGDGYRCAPPILRSEPHPEERALARVSKDGRGPHGSRRPLTRAPHHEGLPRPRSDLPAMANQIRALGCGKSTRRANHFRFSETVSSPEIKNIFVFVLPKSAAYPSLSRPTTGAIARRHESEAGCGGRKSATRAMAIAGREEPRERS